MLTRRLLPVAAVAFVAGLAGVAAAQPAHPSEIPPPQAEGPPPPPPDRRYVWEPGHWHWDGVGWEWHRGHYVIRRAAWHVFVPGVWVLRYGRWIWVPGHWR